MAVELNICMITSYNNDANSFSYEWREGVTQILRMQGPIMSIRKLLDKDFTHHNFDYTIK